MLSKKVILFLEKKKRQAYLNYLQICKLFKDVKQSLSFKLTVENKYTTLFQQQLFSHLILIGNKNMFVLFPFERKGIIMTLYPIVLR